MNNIEWTLATLGTQIPIVIVCLLGILWALPRLDRQPRAGVFVVAGLGLYLLLGIAQIFLQTPIQQLLAKIFGQGQAMMSMRLHYATVGFIFNVVRAISLGLLAFAAFVDRPIVAMLAPGQPMR